MWELDYKESWAPKNWCFWTVLLKKTLESPWDGKEIQPVHSKGNQSWIFIRRTDLKLKLQYFGHLMQRTNSVEKTLMLGKIEGRTRRGQQRMRWLDGIMTRWKWVWVGFGSWWWTRRPGMLQPVRSQIQNNWTDWTEDGSWGHDAMWKKSDRERQVLYDLTYVDSKKTNLKSTKLKEKEVRSMVLRDRRKEVGRLEKPGQKLESPS